MRTRRAFLALAAAACILAACGGRVERVAVVVGGETFSVEVARTEAERSRGLMFRTSIGRREGMLFVFERDEHLVFWMKDTTVPLSIAFLSAEGRILQIEDLQPLSGRPVRSRLSARYALELARGAFAEVGAGEGDAVTLPAGLR